jgi:hypothetical protein
MLTIQDLHSRSTEIRERLDAIFGQIENEGFYNLSYATAAEIITLLIEAKNLTNRINYHSILTSTECHGPH